MALSAIRYLAPTSKSGLGSIIIQCYVNPNASRQSPPGLSFAADSKVKIQLSVPPKDNMANIALIEVLSRALHWPKSDISIIHGERSRYKAICFGGVDAKGDEQAAVENFKERLRSATTTSEVQSRG